MSGEELKKKLESAGISQVEISRKLGVIPQSVSQSLSAKDVKSGFIESLCRVFSLDVAFFYGGETSTSGNEVGKLLDQISTLKEEIRRLKDELRMKDDPEQPTKESEVYRLWMEHMRLCEQEIALSNRMHELYKQQKEG